MPSNVTFHDFCTVHSGGWYNVTGMPNDLDLNYTGVYYRDPHAISQRLFDTQARATPAGGGGPPPPSNAYDRFTSHAEWPRPGQNIS